MVGQKFGKLTVLEYFIRRKGKKTAGFYKCRCDCGKTTNIRQYDLKRGHTTSCGCNLIKDEIGKRYHQLVVISKAYSKSGYIHYNCLCSCGKTTIVSSGNLRSGQTKSCGCMRRLHMQLVGKSKFKHNHPRWDFSKTNLERENKRESLEYNQWRHDVYERDKYTCQICGDSQGGNLEAHHILNYAKYKELRTNLDNGITLCKTCHNGFHNKYGRKNNTLEQLLQYKELKNVQSTPPLVRSSVKLSY